MTTPRTKMMVEGEGSMSSLRKLYRWESGIGLGVILAVLALVPPGARALDPPQGMVLEPRLDAFDVGRPEDKAFVFKGLVDFSGSMGHVEIDVLRAGNGENEATSWEADVARARISNATKVIDGTTFFLWETERIRIFNQDRWPAGGTARVRFTAVRSDGSQALLPVRDEDGVQGPVTELILADKKPTPAKLEDKSKRPNYLGKKINDADFPDQPLQPPGAGPKQATDNYYENVGVGALGETSKGTIDTALPTLKDFKTRYFDATSGFISFGPDRPARYYNRGDLGIGREMHCVFNNLTLETACYVANFGRRDGTPRFGDQDEAFQAMKANKPFAVVAMVERGQMPFDAPNRVFFAVYADPDNPKNANPPLALRAPLDRKEFNTFIPGNCLVCHGSGSSYDKDATEVRGAFFLPFDLKSFRFASKNPHNPLSRAAQEPIFKRLNQIVLNTALFTTAAAVALISGWYGPPGGGLLLDTFQDDFIPVGWDTDDNTRQLYLRVVAPYCRSCHITDSNPALRFATFDDFASFKTFIYNDVCRQNPNPMPNAEQTAKIFWRSSARSQLLNRMLYRFGCGPEMGPLEATP